MKKGKTSSKLSIKYILLILLVLIFVLVGFFLYQKYFRKTQFPPLETITNTRKDAPQPQYFIKEVATNLKVPWSIVFPSADELYVSERVGNVLAVDIKSGTKRNIFTFDETKHSSEAGLMGLAYSANTKTKNLFACLAYENSGELKNKVVQLINEGDNWQRSKTIIDNIPAAKFHAGCRLLIVDNYLFITTGDAQEKSRAQEKEFLGGKILRINLDGTIPSDNPFPNSPVYSLGHRNPQGLSYLKEKNLLISTEHGPSVIDGPPGGDEINIIRSGANYGWPTISHDKSQAGLISPVIQYTPAIAPASALMYDGSSFPQWKHKLFVGGLQSRSLLVIDFAPDFSQVLATNFLEGSQKGRIRDVAKSPDGTIYFSTSNTDGRGQPDENDDRIYRISPNE